jgi:catechol 2,3-dioxygenase-like lactoylglutathione lyase family enzyme
MDFSPRMTRYGYISVTIHAKLLVNPTDSKRTEGVRSMQIVGLDHIQIAMPPGGETEARKFYGDLLGLTEVAKPEPLLARGGCWFEGPGVAVHLGVQPEFIPARKAHPAFLIADLEAFRAKLASAGVPITPDNTLTYVKRFYAADPFGNRLEFIQDGHGFSQQSETQP